MIFSKYLVLPFLFSVDQIKDVVTIEEAVDRKPGMSSDYAIIYGVITSFDLDSENTERFFRTRWFVSFSLWPYEAGHEKSCLFYHKE